MGQSEDDFVNKWFDGNQLPYSITQVLTTERASQLADDGMTMTSQPTQRCVNQMNQKVRIILITSEVIYKAYLTKIKQSLQSMSDH